MKAISIWQPWASLIADGHKHFETRSWNTNHRGDLLICSAQKRLYALQRPFSMSVLYRHGIDYDYLSLPFGMALCVVELLDVYETDLTHLESTIVMTTREWEQEKSLGDYRPGGHAWRLKNVRRFKEPWPVKGQQRLFNVPDDEIARHKLEE